MISYEFIYYLLIIYAMSRSTARTVKSLTRVSDMELRTQFFIIFIVDNDCSRVTYETGIAIVLLTISSVFGNAAEYGFTGCSKSPDQSRKLNISAILQSTKLSFLSNNRQILQGLMDIKKCFEQSLKMSNWSKIYKFELFRVFTKSLIFQSLRSE